MANSLRSNFELDLKDSLIFLKEVLIVAWRLNPAGIAAYSCSELFEAINDNTPPSEKAAMVAEVLGSIEIVPVETFEKDFSDGIALVCKGISSEVINSSVKVYPQIEDYLVARIGREDAIVEESFTRMTLSAIMKQRDHYQQLHTYYAQLIEYLPRYSGIMNRSGILDGVIGFAAGFFGGYAGAAGAEVWGNWRNANDEEFCQKFGNAFQQFAEACFKYTNDGEEKLSVVFDRLTDEIKSVHHLIFDCYDELAETGWDIEPLHKSYRALDEPLDDDTRQLFEIAVSNLEENRSVHFRTIENVRSMMGLREDFPSTATHVDDSPAAVAIESEEYKMAGSKALVNKAELTVEFIRSVIGDFSCDGFFLDQDAPQKKVLGAIGSYAPQVRPEQVLLLCDNTVFGSAKEGFLLTPSSIHWRNSSGGAKFALLESIQEGSLKESSSIFQLAEITFNEETIEVNGPSPNERNQIARYLIRIIEANQ